MEKRERYRNTDFVASALRRGSLGGADGLGGLPAQQVTVGRDPSQLARYWHVFWEHKTAAAVIIAACVGVSLLFAVVQPANYRATASLELLGVNSNFLNLQAINPNSELSAGSAEAESHFQTQIELLKSESLVERAVLATGLDLNDRFVRSSANPLMAKIKALTVAAGLRTRSEASTSEEERRHRAVAAAQSRLKVQQVHSSNLVEIAFEDIDPKLAVDFVNALANEGVRDDIESRSAFGGNLRRSLENHLADLRARLNRAENDVVSYASNSGLLLSGEAGNAEAGNADDARLQRLQDQLSHAQSERIQKETLNTIANEADPETLPEVLDDPVLKEYRLRLVDLRKQEAELSSTFNPAYPKAKRLQAEIAELEEMITKEIGNVKSRIGNEYRASKRNEEAVVAEYSSQSAKVGELSQKTIHYNTLKQELETTRSLYEEMLKRVNEAELASVVRTGGLRVVDAARYPKPPGLSKVLLLCSIGLFSGVLVAAASVFVIDQISSTVSMPGHASAMLSVMELGTIPSARRKDRGSLLSVDGRRLHSSTDHRLGASSNGTNGLLRSRVPRGGASLFEDSFRSAINSILFALDESAEHCVIAVSSPGTHEGKTTITANLGGVLAEIGNRVLLIDSDLRKPTLHTLLGVENTTGMADLLAHNVPLTPEDVRSIVKRSESGQIDVLTAGTVGGDSFDLFHSKRISELIQIVRAEYALVLIDTAPLLLVPESRTIGRLADCSILILRAGRTTGDAALAARQQMTDDRIPLLGSILNDCRRKTARGYRYAV
jgi:polysaccharide biosynthesis transport protein